MKTSSLPWVIAITSLVLFVVATQYFQSKYMLSTEVAVLFEADSHLESLWRNDSESKQSTDVTSAIRVVYFWQSNCPCDATVITHFKELIETYSGSVDFIVADLSPKPRADLLSEFTKMAPEQVAKIKGSVTHTPAVGVWDKDGKLTYFGPHNLGFVCNAKTSFLIKVLDTLLINTPSENISTLGDGCFCPVQHSVSV